MHALAEGWTAGLRILLEQARCPASARTRGVPAEREALFEALAQEIFDRQEAPMQVFLLRVSRLPRMRVDAEGLDALRRGIALGAEQDLFNYPWFRPDMVARLVRTRQLHPPVRRSKTGLGRSGFTHSLGRFSLTADDQPVNAEGKARQKLQQKKC